MQRAPPRSSGGLGCVEPLGDVLRPIDPERDGGTAADSGTAIPDAAPPPEPCGPPSWRWLNPLPQGFDPNAVWGATEADLWLVGNGGTILRWQGRSVIPVKSPTTANLYAIWGSGPRDIWIVDQNPASVLRFVGTTYRDLWRGSGASARIVGVKGFIGRVDGSGLTRVSQDLDEGSLLQGMWASGPDDLSWKGRLGCALDGSIPYRRYTSDQALDELKMASWSLSTRSARTAT
jgi:hypothetical protein